MSVLRFFVKGKEGRPGRLRRRELAGTGCSESYTNHYWCPRLRLFIEDSCPFISLRECADFKNMCGAS
ncbi:MAG: hypothetical protein L3J03_09385 [Desulfobacterales bacterium]|nr:hypothetical protein [Desulfobacterales bacterium]